MKTRIPLTHPATPCPDCGHLACVCYDRHFTPHTALCAPSVPLCLCGEKPLATLRLPFPLPSINDILHHTNWRQQKRAADAMKTATAWALKTSQPTIPFREPTPFQGPIKLHYTVHLHRLDNDPDNRYSKYVTDTLVTLRIIQKDNALCVRSVEHTIQRTQEEIEYTTIDILRSTPPAPPARNRARARNRSTTPTLKQALKPTPRRLTKAQLQSLPKGRK